MGDTTQTVNRCNLAIDTFETLGKCRANYAYHLYERDRKAGKPIHRRHAHMHTRAEKGIHVDLANELEMTFAWVPPLAAHAEHPDDYLAGPESISVDEIDTAFDELEKEKVAAPHNDVDGGEVLEGEIYNFAELDRIDEGLAPRAFEEDVSTLRGGSGGGSTWDVDALMSARGVSSL